MHGQRLTVEWQGRQVAAWAPDLLTVRSDETSSALARRTERAASAVRRAEELLPGTWEPIARILLRTEGIASSDIEGLRAPIEAIVTAELDVTAIDPTAAWIADNLAVVTDAIGAAHGPPLAVATLHRWHRRLMRHSSLPPPLIGRFRPSEGWIGGVSPVDAVYVPPPPELVTDLMEDLVAYANRSDPDPVVQAATVHAQFETIHPYGDGNGRLGRVLISWVLARRLEVSLPPPVSVLIARDPGGYLSGLYQFREGSPDAYLGWFSDIVARAGDASVILGEQIRALLADWSGRLAGVRSDAATLRLAAMLPEHPLLNATLAAERAGVSERAARDALATLEAQGIMSKVSIKGTGPGRPRQWWLARELLELVGRWAS